MPVPQGKITTTAAWQGAPAPEPEVVPVVEEVVAPAPVAKKKAVKPE